MSPYLGVHKAVSMVTYLEQEKTAHVKVHVRETQLCTEQQARVKKRDGSSPLWTAQKEKALQN